MRVSRPRSSRDGNSARRERRATRDNFRIRHGISPLLTTRQLAASSSASWFAPKVGQQVHLRAKSEYVACFMLILVFSFRCGSMMCLSLQFREPINRQIVRETVNDSLVVLLTFKDGVKCLQTTINTYISWKGAKWRIEIMLERGTTKESRRWRSINSIAVAKTKPPPDDDDVEDKFRSFDLLTLFRRFN